MSKWLQYLKKIRPYNIQKGFRYLKHYGAREFFVRLFERMEPEEVPYAPWFEKHRISDKELEMQRQTKLSRQPLISIAVPAYQTPTDFLAQMIDSLIAQSYANWELCIANGSPSDAKMSALLADYAKRDKRVRYVDITGEQGIAENTNAALAMATGDFIGLLDHDDLLAPNALFEVAKTINGNDTFDVIYTDEDKVTTDLTEHFQPHFKPDLNIDLLRSNNYICHFFVVRKSLAKTVGGFRKEFDGAQDYDFIFRCIEEARAVAHIPQVLYHWRTHRDSTADNPASKMYAFEAGRRAIKEHLKRQGQVGEVTHTKDFGFYKVTYPVKDNPLVSIIIPNKDQSEMLKMCIDSIYELSTYTNFEILIIENNSTEDKTFAYYEELKQRDNILVLQWGEENGSHSFAQPPHNGFNYSAINNFAVQSAKGEYVLFLNNDIKVITPNWIEELLGNVQRSEVGIVGGRLYFPDDTIQHAGIIVGIGGIAGHAFLGMNRVRTGYLHKAAIQQDLSAVTAACMIMKKSIFEELGGFEEELTVAFNDVDLCLRTVASGYLVVYNPGVEMYHYESKSRGAEDSEAKVRRFQTEIEYMRTNWIDLLKAGDPNYNKNLTLSKWNYSLRQNP